jgi:serine palmitoyltransferase
MIPQSSRVLVGLVGLTNPTKFSISCLSSSHLSSSSLVLGCLVISDKLNHMSIWFGTRISGVSVRMFRHKPRSTLDGSYQSRATQNTLAQKKILVIVEGLYNMGRNIG